MMKIKIIGIGNAYRHDDGAGLIAAEKLLEKDLQGVEVVTESGEGTALMDAWQGAETVIIIDSASSGAEPGTIHRIDANTQVIPFQRSTFSSHAFGLNEAVEMARHLGQLPPNLVVFGVEGKGYSYGRGISKEVQIGVEEVVRQVLVEIKDVRDKIPHVSAAS